MALVSGGRSTLNPDAPLFIPAAMRQVVDFSPEWWNLVNTSAWYRDHWLSQNPGEDIFGEVEGDYGVNNVMQLLPDSIDLDVDEDILNMESQFEEFLRLSEAENRINAGRGYDHTDARFKNVEVSTMKKWDELGKHGGASFEI